MTLTPTGTQLVTSTASNTTACVSSSFTPSVGDIIVVKYVTEDSNKQMAAPTDTQGNTYSLRNSSTTSSNCFCAIYTATASAATANVVTSGTWSGAAGWHSMAVERWPASTCQLAATPATNATKTGTSPASTTLTSAANSSAVTWCCGDWAAVAPTGRTYYNSATNVGVHDKSPSFYVGYYAYQQAATAGSQQFGISVPSGQTWAMVGVEIQAKTGGTTYTPTPSDAAGTTDAIAVEVRPATTDSLGITDSTQLSIGISPTDSIGVTDTPAISQSISISDDAGLADAISAVLAQVATPSDSIGVTDQSFFQLEIAPTDLLGISDTLSIVINRNIALSDDVGMTDPLSYSSGNSTINIDDTEGVTDSPYSLTRSGSAEDATGITDTVIVLMSFNVTLSDVIGLNDPITLLQDKKISDDSGVTGEAFGVSSGTNAISLSDSIGLGDSSQSITRSCSSVEAMGVTDSLSVSLFSSDNNQISLIGVSDSLVATLTRFFNLLDNVGITDPGAVTSSLEGITDSSGLTDSLSAVLVPAVNSITDVIVVTDTLTVAISAAISDNVSVTDSVSPSLTTSGTSLTESESVTDTLSWSIVRNISITDLARVTDSIITNATNTISSIDVLYTERKTTNLVLWSAGVMGHIVGIVLGQPIQTAVIMVRRNSTDGFVIRWFEDTAHTIPKNIDGESLAVLVGDNINAPLRVWDGNTIGNETTWELTAEDTNVPWGRMAGYIMLDEEILLSTSILFQP